MADNGDVTHEDPCGGVDPDRLDAVIRNVERLKRGEGMTLDEACRETLGLVGDADLVSCARARIQRRMEEIRTRRRPGWVAEHGFESWYLGPHTGDLWWPSFRSQLVGQQWDPEDIEDVDRSSTKVVAHLGDPHTAGFRRRGLVLGYVQSGKTTNFTAVMAKAADAGYAFFIVLSGIHNSLRRQTQERLEEQLVGPHPEDWIPVTEREQDFSGAQPAAALLGRRTQAKVLCVIKKNGPRLRRLLEWLRAASPEVLARCPTLIIDDEADQASVNAARPENDPTVINGLIREMIELLPKVTYVGYTATPFANVLIDPNADDDLYPRDFIVDLPRPSSYIGPETIFGREPLELDREGEEPVDGYDMIREVPPQELVSLRPEGQDISGFAPDLTASLSDAIRYFWLSTTARRLRGVGSQHATMLLHTSMRVHVHDQFRDLLERERERIERHLAEGDEATLTAFEELWKWEQAAVASTDWGYEGILFADLLPSLRDTVAKTSVVMDNSMSQARLDYTGESPVTVIAVGGNTLSRGLTLEGLCVSFFVRSASAYDTLLQMGRWFGYRRGYEDLPRIWMTAELREWFRHLATVEQEIRYDIERFEREHLTPRQLGVRIRTHPALAVTAAAKMQHAVNAQVSYSGRRLQTILFQHRDPDWLDANLMAARDLVSDVSGFTDAMQPEGTGSWIFRDIPWTNVVRFLEAYAFHDRARDLNAGAVLKYLRSQASRGELERWTIGVMGLPRPDPELGSIDLGLPDRVAMIRRSRLLPRPDQSYADIKALMSRQDSTIDLEASPEQLRKYKPGEVGRVRNSPERGGCGDDSGLLLLYPVSRQSRPRAQNATSRQNLDAVDDVIGVGLVFPEAIADEGAQSYMTADLSSEVTETPTEEDELSDDSDGEDAVPVA